MRYALHWYVYDREGYVIREDLVCARLVMQVTDGETLRDAIAFTFADYVSYDLEWTPDGFVVQGVDYPEGIIREY